MNKNIILVGIISLLLIASVTAWNWPALSNTNTQEHTHAQDAQDAYTTLSTAYADTIQKSPWNTVCVHVDNEAYQASKETLTTGCDNAELDITINPDVLNMRSIDEFNTAYAQGKIRPSMWTRIKVITYCSLNMETCTV